MFNVFLVKNNACAQKLTLLKLRPMNSKKWESYAFVLFVITTYIFQHQKDLSNNAVRTVGIRQILYLLLRMKPLFLKLNFDPVRRLQEPHPALPSILLPNTTLPCLMTNIFDVPMLLVHRPAMLPNEMLFTSKLTPNNWNSNICVRYAMSSGSPPDKLVSLLFLLSWYII